MAAEERYTRRLEQVKPVLEALFAWANELKDKTAPKSALGKALHYLLEQWPYLLRYLEDGRLEIWNSQENRTPMSKTLSGKRVIGEASSFDQWREIQGQSQILCNCQKQCK